MLELRHIRMERRNGRAGYPATIGRAAANHRGRWRPWRWPGGDGATAAGPGPDRGRGRAVPGVPGAAGVPGRLYGCLTARPDASFELCDAILCADHAVTSLAELSLVPEFRRGHGALYDALAAGRIDEEKLAALLTGTLPRWSTGARARPGWLSTTGSTTACSSGPWRACQPSRPRRSGTRAPAGGGCGSRSTPRPIPGLTPNAPRAAVTSIMTPAAATAPARRFPAGSTSSPRRSGTCAPPGPP